AAEGVDQLPQLPGSGQIHSIAYKATNDATFRADWTALTDATAALTPDAFRAQFESLLLRWAGVEGVEPFSRGGFVDAQHLAFVEHFFGDTYREVRRTGVSATSPSEAALGASVENSYQQIVDLLSLAFLAQSVQSQIARGGDIGIALNSPYLFYALLDFRTDLAEGEEPSPTPGNLGVVADLILSSAPGSFGEAVACYRMAA
ncbi:MAG: hypothetical protein ACRCXM_17415, partial [Beijerinckiaceae bacterium]